MVLVFIVVHGTFIVNKQDLFTTVCLRSPRNQSHRCIDRMDPRNECHFTHSVSLVRYAKYPATFNFISYSIRSYRFKHGLIDETESACIAI
jgi:hypothetical protein